MPTVIAPEIPVASPGDDDQFGMDFANVFQIPFTLVAAGLTVTIDPPPGGTAPTAGSPQIDGTQVNFALDLAAATAGLHLVKVTCSTDDGRTRNAYGYLEIENPTV